MASSRRKLDEKHLKILRELGTKPANRTCFDCLQKGPTYINMTIGSFVCTSCSGILRGLNPPHRVKSISMASFTPEEIEQIKCKGNENCQSVWLGLYDGKSSLFPDTKDEHKIRDFMIQKYEKKRFYVDPSVAFKNVGGSNCKSGSSSNASTPGSGDSKSLGSGNAPAGSNPNTSVSRPISSLQTAGSSPCLNGLQQSTTLKSSSSLGLSAMKPSSSLVLLSGLENSSTNSFKNQSSENIDPFGFSEIKGDKATAGFANFDKANIFSNSTEDRLFSVPSSVPGTSILPNSPLKSSPAHYSYSLSSSPACYFPPPYPRKFSLSPTPSPEVNPWESLEEDLSAAMPLIPTGELPPTYQPCSDSGKSTNKGVSGSPVIFAAGVSAQFVAPSIDIKSKDRLAHLRETRAASLPSSLSGSYFKAVQQEFKNSPDTKKEVKFKKQNKDDIKKLPSYDKYFAVEHPLTSAMPLISQEDQGSESFNAAKRDNAQSKSFNRNASLPLGSIEKNTSDETLSRTKAEEAKKTSSATDLRSKGLSGLFSPSKNIRKVSSYHNITAHAMEIEENNSSSKKIFSRQLSAISQKMRARLMFDEDLQQSKPRLSSSLPENSPQSKVLNANLIFANPPNSNNVAQVEPITVTYRKSFNINKASDFTNTNDGWCADFSTQKNSDNNSAFFVFDKSRTFCSDFNQGGHVSNEPRTRSFNVAEKPLHVSLTNNLDFCNFSNASDNCSSLNANLTCLASPFVAGASNSKSLTTLPHPPFSSNPLTPFSSSSSNTLLSNVVTSTTNGGENATSSANGPEDRYAALKDLDEIFKNQKEVEKPPQNNGNLGLFGTSPTSANAFGSSNGLHYSQNGSSTANAAFGTSPISGNPPTTNSGSAWNPSFNPFSGTQSANSATPWSNSPAFGTYTQSQANPFAGGIDPNFNSSFGSALNGTSSIPNTNWANFNSPTNTAVGAPSTKITPNPWSSNASPNPFANSQVPLNGSPFNPFL